MYDDIPKPTFKKKLKTSTKATSAAGVRKKKWVVDVSTPNVQQRNGQDGVCNPMPLSFVGKSFCGAKTFADEGKSIDVGWIKR